MAARHFSTQMCESVFSSWSQSLGFVLDVALDNLGKPNAHISIIDTKRLPSKNVILFSPKLGFLSDAVRIPSHYRWEYLEFGKITGEAHHAVPVEEFVRQGYQVPYEH